MIRQRVYTDNSNSDDDDSGLHDVMLRFKDALFKHNDKGWECGRYTITKADDGDWLLVVVLSQVVEKV